MLFLFVFQKGRLKSADNNKALKTILHTKHQGSRPSGFSEVFYVSTIQANVKHVTPRVKPFLNKLGSSRPCGFKQEGFCVLFE